MANATPELRAAIEELEPHMRRVSTFFLPFFPNTFMLAYALAKAGFGEKLQYVSWNHSPLKRLNDEELGVTVATQHMLLTTGINGLPLACTAYAPITSFDPKYVYVVRHFQFRDHNIRSLGAMDMCELAKGFQQVVLFGDTHEQTAALHQVIERWLRPPCEVRFVTARDWNIVAKSRTEEHAAPLTLELYYMSPARRVALDRAKKDYMRLSLQREVLGDEIKVHFNTYAVASVREPKDLLHAKEVTS